MKITTPAPKRYFVWDDQYEDNKPEAPNVHAMSPHDAAEQCADNERTFSDDEIELAVQEENEPVPTLYVVRKVWQAEKSPRKWEP